MTSPSMHQMLSLDDPNRPPTSETLDQPSGFMWWYAEIMDAQRNGLVLIWSFGLPFLPGYMSSARTASPQTPRSRPSLNLAIYTHGKPTFYMLREFDPAHVSWNGHDQWQFGASTITARPDNARPDNTHTKTLDIVLDCPLDQGRDHIRGHVQITGTIPQHLSASPPAQSPHLWTPLLLPAHGTANLQLDNNKTFKIQGRAYHDRNHSPCHLEALGIQTWLWGRASWPDVERIFYVLWSSQQAERTPPACVGFEVDSAGYMRSVPLTVDLPAPNKTLYGMPHWPDLMLLSSDGQPWMRIQQDQRVDHGPFYLRHFTTNRAPSHLAPAHGTCETIVPSRIDLAIHRPLVKMRVSAEQRPNSVWLPLFEGSSEGRASRLLRQWLAR